jgi:hypothetical protein
VQTGDHAAGEPLAVQSQRGRAALGVDLGVEQRGEQELGVEQVTDDDVVPARADRLPRDSCIADARSCDDGGGDALRGARGHVLLDGRDPAAKTAAFPSDGPASRHDVEVDEVHLRRAGREPRQRQVVRVARAGDRDPRAAGDDRVQDRPELGPRPSPARRAIRRGAAVAADVGGEDHRRRGGHRVTG